MPGAGWAQAPSARSLYVAQGEMPSVCIRTCRPKCQLRRSAGSCPMSAPGLVLEKGSGEPAPQAPSSAASVALLPTTPRPRYGRWRRHSSLFFPRAAQWHEKMHSVVKMPWWDCARSWRLGGHIARPASRDPSRLVAPAPSWRDATYCETLRGILERPSDPARGRLATKQNGAPVSRWWDPFQPMCNQHSRAWAP